MRLRSHLLPYLFAGIPVTAILIPLASPSALAKRGPANGDAGPHTLDTGDANDAVDSSTATATDEAEAKALAAMDVAADKVKKTYEASSDWTTAATAYANAHDDYQAKLKAATAGLASNPDYAAATAARDKAQSDLETLRNNGGSMDQITAAATAAMDARAEVTKLQTTVVQNDATVTAAKSAMEDAAAAMDVQRQKEKDAIAADPDYQSAKKAYDDAKAQAGTPAPTSQPAADTTPPATPPPTNTGKHHHHNSNSGSNSNNSSNNTGNSNNGNND